MRMDGLRLRPVRLLIFSQAVACCFDTCWRDIVVYFALDEFRFNIGIGFVLFSSELCLHFVVRSQMVDSSVGS